MDTNKLKMEWKKFVERIEPDLFVTITFRTFTSQNMAIKRFKSFFKFLNKPDRIFYNKFILSWVYFENRVKGEGCHIHALIKGVDTFLASILENKCKKAFGSSKVKPYDHNIVICPASEYLADKCVNYNSDNLKFFKINSRFRGRK
ncbi:hypothetical protein ACFL96_04705 [Thermoproteota archaeon]